MRLIDADDFANRMYHEAFEKDTDMQRWDSGCWIRYKLFENVLREQPTAQPERKRGKWIPFDIPWYRCSECGAERENTAFMEYFCPNCGADMRGGGE